MFCYSSELYHKNHAGIEDEFDGKRNLARSHTIDKFTFINYLANRWSFPSRYSCKITKNEHEN